MFNTGAWNGVNATFERLIDQRVYWSICQKHTKELPLRHAITKIDGKTTSDTGFSGPIGQLLCKVEEMEYDPSFVPLPDYPDMIEIPENILKDMSHDSKQCYLLEKAVKSGSLPISLQYMKCGESDHA